MKFLFLKTCLVVLSLTMGQMSFAQKASYHAWQWQKSDCNNCRIVFNVAGESAENKELREFIKAIQDSKFEIIKLYNSDSQEYNLLAHMAIGILGNESAFFKNWRYIVKKNSQMAITAAKALKVAYKNKDDIEVLNVFSAHTMGLPFEMAKIIVKTPANSKGPTQIKNVPDNISKYYQFTEEDLWIPRNAALATMGYLIEALRQLKQMAKNNNLEFITQETIVDYLPYIYFGRSQLLRDRTATPDQNIYVKSMKNNMKIVEPLELY